VHLKTPFSLCVQLVKFFSVNGTINLSSQREGICRYACSSICFVAPVHRCAGKLVHFDAVYLKSFPALIISELFLESAIEKCSRKVQ